jgi:hypothetical protein
VKNPVRNETSVILVVAVVFSAVAIPVMSGLLEPSQPPAVAAVQVGDPRDGVQREDGAPARTPQSGPAPARDAERHPPAASPARRHPAPAPSPPADDLAGDDGGEAD